MGQAKTLSFQGGGITVSQGGLLCLSGHPVELYVNELDTQFEVSIYPKQEASGS